MHRYDDQVPPYVVLRRIIIIVAVLIAVPVALWTVTGAVRTYVAPPKLPAFRQLATTVTEQQESTGATTATGDQSLWQTVTSFVSAHVGVPQIPSVRQLAAMFTGDSAASSRAAEGTSPTSVEASAMATDVRDLPGSSKEPLTSGADASASTTKMTDASPTPVIPKSATMPVALAADPQAADASLPSSRNDAAAPGAWPPPPQQNGTPQTNAPWPPAPQPITAQTAGQLAATEPPAAADDSTTALVPTGQPLTGRIPLPRRRPSDLTMVQITAANVPMPRPRPEIVSSVAPAETEPSSPGALNFLNNLFH